MGSWRFDPRHWSLDDWRYFFKSFTEFPRWSLSQQASAVIGLLVAALAAWALLRVVRSGRAGRAARRGFPLNRPERHVDSEPLPDLHWWLLGPHEAMRINSHVAEVSARWPGRVVLASEPEVRLRGLSTYRWLSLPQFAADRLGRELGL